MSHFFGQFICILTNIFLRMIFLRILHEFWDLEFQTAIICRFELMNGVGRNRALMIRHRWNMDHFVFFVTTIFWLLWGLAMRRLSGGIQRR